MYSNYNVELPEFNIIYSDYRYFTVAPEGIPLKRPSVLQYVFKYFAIFKNVAHSLEPGETPSNSSSYQAPNYVQRS